MWVSHCQSSWRVTQTAADNFLVTGVKADRRQRRHSGRRRNAAQPDCQPTKNETINALIMPLEEGDFSVTFTLTYTDDLNRKQTMVRVVNGRSGRYRRPRPK